MSMAAKLSDLVNKMPGANLQADGQVEVPTQGAKDLWWSGEADSSPSPSPSWSPARRPLSGHPNVRYCLDMSNFDRRIGGCTPTFSLLGQPHCWKICCEKQELDLPKSW